MFDKKLVERALVALEKTGTELARHNKLQELCVQDTYMDVQLQLMYRDGKEPTDKERAAITALRREFSHRIYEQVNVLRDWHEKNAVSIGSGVCK